MSSTINQPIRIGLIGCGGIVQGSHLPSHLSMPDLVQVAALADPVEANRETTGNASLVSPQHRFEDHRDMLDKCELDAVVIATPHHLHKEHAIDAAQAGVAVLSEKPMGLSLDEADAILEAVRTHQVNYTVVHNFLFSLPMQRAQEILRAEDAGPVYGRAQSLFHKPARLLSTELWRNQESAGGGCLNDTAYHDIYLLEDLMGSPVKHIEARVQSKFLGMGVDDLTLLLFEHENGAVSTVSTSWGVPTMDASNWCEVHSQTGSVRVVARSKELHRFYREERKWEQVMKVGEDVPAPVTQHANWFAATFKAMTQGSEMPVTGEQARHNMAIIAAARLAAEKRASVEVQ
ncbi:MAG: Gfo/Idh/MocA family oxidoreductase [Planctomycetota bacterium]|nr:Gfo/Idh/MocA family oxidoreductase [Planctomycetota bacterium]